MKKIAFISQPEYFRALYENDLENDFIVKEFPFTFDMSPDKLDDLIAFEADYNIFFRGEFFPSEILDQLKGKKIAISSEPFPRKIDGHWEYTLDSIGRYGAFRNIRHKNFDYVFHYDISSADLFSLDGMEISGEFILPVATKVYKKKECEKKWDIFFIGRSTAHREKFFMPLKHHFNFLHVAHGIWGEDLVDFYNSSKILLNVHAEPEISWEPRMQQMMTTGGFVISEKITPNAYIRPGIEYIQADEPLKMFKKVEYYLKHAEERSKIADQGYFTAQEKFDSKENFKKLIADIEKNKFPKFKIMKKSTRIDLLCSGGKVLQKAKKIFNR